MPPCCTSNSSSRCSTLRRPRGTQPACRRCSDGEAPLHWVWRLQVAAATSCRPAPPSTAPLCPSNRQVRRPRGARCACVPRRASAAPPPPSMAASIAPAGLSPLTGYVMQPAVMRPASAPPPLLGRWGQQGRRGTRISWRGCSRWSATTWALAPPPAPYNPGGAPHPRWTPAPCSAPGSCARNIWSLSPSGRGWRSTTARWCRSSTRSGRPARLPPKQPSKPRGW
mmetsp:Transcript_8268/g.24683  ORF Transcript_8268/g.24683 Transcript_8268/m.24683 type:complete len:225 (-) Transcript_8268:6-680(-)